MATRYQDDEDWEYEAPRKKSSSGGKKKKSKKKVSAKAKAKKKRRRILLFLAEIVVLAIMLIVLWGVTRTEKVGHLEIQDEDIVVNEGVEELTVMKGYRNVALFGVDSTTGALTKNTRSDTIMIASINLDTKEIKLVSVYRDTFLNIGNDKYIKCNTAYANGGPKQAINMLNANLDMNITDFVTVGFAGLIDTIDALGGIPIEVTNAEIGYLNDYQYCIAEDLKRTYTPVKSAGMQVLDGMQATGYCRIRYTAGDDFKRAERQRTVIKAIMDKSKEASVGQLTEIANDVFDEVYTSFDISEIIELLADASQYKIVADDGFPTADMRWTGEIGSKGSSVVPDNLADNVSWLHELFFDESDYVPSKEVQEYSEHIASETAKYRRD